MSRDKFFCKLGYDNEDDLRAEVFYESDELGHAICRALQSLDHAGTDIEILASAIVNLWDEDRCEDEKVCIAEEAFIRAASELLRAMKEFREPAAEMLSNTNGGTTWGRC